MRKKMKNEIKIKSEIDNKKVREAHSDIFMKIKIHLRERI